MTDTRRVASTRGVGLALHDLGGTGRPVLICHATGFCGKAYLPLAAELGARFHVWAMDFRGHGESDAPPDDDYSWWRMAEDARAVADELGQPLVLGHSMGAAAALLAEVEHPGTFAAAYVYEPALDRERPAGLVEGMVEHTLKRAAVFGSRDEASARFRERDTYRDWTPTALDAFVRHALMDLPDGRVTLRCRPEHEALCYTSPKVGVPDLADVSIRVRVGLGLEGDHLGSAQAARDLAAALSRADVSEHPGVGHFGPFEAPAAVAAAAAGLFAEL